MRLLPSLAVSLFVAVVAACSSGSSDPPPIVASDYDQSCSTDADCVLIHDGDPCTCGSGLAAINVKDKQRYESDFAQRAAACPSHPICGGALPCTSPVCVSNRCTTHAPCFAPDAGADGS